LLIFYETHESTQHEWALTLNPLNQAKKLEVSYTTRALKRKKKEKRRIANNSEQYGKTKIFKTTDIDQLRGLQGFRKIQQEMD